MNSVLKSLLQDKWTWTLHSISDTVNMCTLALRHDHLKKHQFASCHHHHHWRNFIFIFICHTRFTIIVLTQTLLGPLWSVRLIEIEGVGHTRPESSQSLCLHNRSHRSITLTHTLTFWLLYRLYHLHCVSQLVPITSLSPTGLLSHTSCCLDCPTFSPLNPNLFQSLNLQYSDLQGKSKTTYFGEDRNLGTGTVTHTPGWYDRDSANQTLLISVISLSFIILSSSSAMFALFILVCYWTCPLFLSQSIFF